VSTEKPPTKFWDISPDETLRSLDKSPAFARIWVFTRDNDIAPCPLANEKKKFADEENVGRTMPT